MPLGILMTTSTLLALIKALVAYSISAFTIWSQQVGYPSDDFLIIGITTVAGTPSS